MKTQKEKERWGRLIDIEERMYRAMEKRIEKKDRNAVERFLKAWAKQDIKDLRRWEKRFARD